MKIFDDDPPDTGKHLLQKVYFIQVGAFGPVKIGTGCYPEKRLNELQVGHPEWLRLIGMIPGDAYVEREWHVWFAAHHIRGEWFKPVPALMAAIAEAVLAVRRLPPEGYRRLEYPSVGENRG